MSHAIISGPYFRDILGQPAALRAVAAALPSAVPGELAPAALAGFGIERIVLTGMGSSFHALYPLHLRLSRRLRSCFHVETSELLAGFEALRGPGTLLIAVSQSGESAEIVRLIEQRSGYGRLIAVTNEPGSRLAAAAGTTLLLQAGVEATVSCKTYVNTLAVLHWLGAALGGEDIDHARAELAALAPAVEGYLAGWAAHTAELCQRLTGVRSFFITGRGASLATAGTGALTFKESTRRHAEGMSSAAFRHGPFEMVGDEIFVLVLGGEEKVSALNRRLAGDIAKAGGRVAFAAPQEATSEVFRLPEGPASLLPVLEILPVQMMSLAIARLDGREAGRFERASKVTVVE